MNTLFVGITPRPSGSVALITVDNVLFHVDDLPINKKKFNTRELYRMLKCLKENFNLIAGLETYSLENMIKAGKLSPGVILSLANYSYSTATILELLKITYTPVLWTDIVTQHGTKDKDELTDIVASMYSGSEGIFKQVTGAKTVRKHGRAEAALTALHTKNKWKELTNYK